MRARWLVGWAVMAGCGGATKALPEVQGGRLTVVHTARMEGELEPCG
jgi:hypothetical protein